MCEEGPRALGPAWRRVASRQLVEAAVPRRGDMEAALQLNFNVSRFIEEVGERPLLYDPGCPHYTDREAKMAAWEQVLEACVPAWETCGSKHELLVLMQKKWKNIRDTYVRENRNSKQGKHETLRKKKNYVHYKQLRFLDGIVRTKVVGQLGSGEDELHDKCQVMDSICTETARKTVFHSPRKRRKVAGESPSKRYAQGPAPAATPTAPSAPAQPPTLAAPQDDGDRLFLLSMLSDMKRVPEQLKLEAKCELLNVIKRYSTFTCASVVLEDSHGFAFKSSPRHSSEESD